MDTLVNTCARIIKPKKALIVSVNPTWRDQSDGWYDGHQFQPDSA
jgi:hypothetical protein